MDGQAIAYTRYSIYAVVRKKYHSATACPKHSCCHWMPVEQRITFKLVMLTHNTLLLTSIPFWIITLSHVLCALQTLACCLFLVFALPLPTVALVLQSPHWVTVWNSLLLWHLSPFLCPYFPSPSQNTASSRPSALPSGSPKSAQIRPLASWISTAVDSVNVTVLSVWCGMLWYSSAARNTGSHVHSTSETRSSRQTLCTLHTVSLFRAKFTLTHVKESGYPCTWYSVSQKKTCDYIFYNNLNNKCPITIIFGILSRDCASSKEGFISHLTYLVQLSYLGEMPITRNGKFCLFCQYRCYHCQGTTVYIPSC